MAPFRQESTGDLLTRQVLEGALRVYSRPEHTLVPCSSCLVVPMLSFWCLLAAASLHVPRRTRRAGGGGAVNEIGKRFCRGSTRKPWARVRSLSLVFLVPPDVAWYVVLPDSVCTLWFRCFPECDRAALLTATSTTAAGGRCGICDQRTERSSSIPPMGRTSTSITVPMATTSPWGERVKKSVAPARGWCQCCVRRRVTYRGLIGRPSPHVSFIHQSHVHHTHIAQLET